MQYSEIAQRIKDTEQALAQLRGDVAHALVESVGDNVPQGVIDLPAELIELAGDLFYLDANRGTMSLTEYVVSLIIAQVPTEEASPLTNMFIGLTDDVEVPLFVCEPANVA